MTATAEKLFEDQVGPENGKRSAWQGDFDPSTETQSPTVLRRPNLGPKQLKTLMSEQQLESCGLRFMSYAAEEWLVPIDSHPLVNDRLSSSWLESLRERIRELNAISADEDLNFNEQSAAEALEFSENLNSSRRPSAFLVGNGNIRLLWTRDGEQVGLQFKGNKIIQYVIFVRRGDTIATHMGMDDSATIMKQISALGVRRLLNV